MRRLWVLVALVLVGAVGCGLLAWKVSRSDQTFPAGYGITVRRDVGETVWSTLMPSEGGADEVRITDLEPVIADVSADPEVEYVICDLDLEVLGAEKVDGFGFGLRDAALDRYCTSTRPAVGATLDLRAGAHQELLVGVTTTKPGRAAVTHHRISFRDGWRWGSDEIHAEVVVHARGTADRGPRSSR